jgi:hypothetical protein
MCAYCSAAVAEEDVGLSGIDSGGVESVQWGLREFWVEMGNHTGWATIYRFKTIRSGS